MGPVVGRARRSCSLNDSAGNDGGAAGQTAFVSGGPTALAGALMGAARAAGVEVRTGAEVASVLTRDGRVDGVRLASGERAGRPGGRRARSTRRRC